MLNQTVVKQNAMIMTSAIDLVLATMTNLQGGYIGKIDKDAVAEIAAAELNQELINRREHDAK